MVERRWLDSLRNSQRKNEGVEVAPSPAAVVDAPSAEEDSKVPSSSPAEALDPSPVSSLKEAAKAALEGAGTGVTEVSLPQEVVSGAQKVSRSVSVVSSFTSAPYHLLSVDQMRLTY